MSPRWMSPRWLTAALLISLGVNAVLGGLLLSHRLAGGDDRLAARGERREGVVRWRDSRLARRLGLDEAQVAALEAQNRELSRKLSPLREKMRGARRQVIALLKEERTDEARLQAVLREMAGYQAAIEEQYSLSFLQMKGVLTGEQEKLFFRLLEDRFSSQKPNANRAGR